MWPAALRPAGMWSPAGALLACCMSVQALPWESSRCSSWSRCGAFTACCRCCSLSQICFVCAALDRWCPGAPVASLAPLQAKHRVPVPFSTSASALHHLRGHLLLLTDARAAILNTSSNMMLSGGPVPVCEQALGSLATAAKQQVGAGPLSFVHAGRQSLAVWRQVAVSVPCCCREAASVKGPGRQGPGAPRLPLFSSHLPPLPCRMPECRVYLSLLRRTT